MTYQLWLSLSIDGQIHDLRRLTVTGELGELVPASALHDVLSMYQQHMTAVATARHWSLEILDPSSDAAVHIESDRPTSTRINGRGRPVTH